MKHARKPVGVAELRRNRSSEHRSILVRHAEAPFDPSERAHLTAGGRENACKIPTLLGGFTIDAIYSSPYPRARQTVEPLAQTRGIEISEVHDLRERRLSAEPIEEWEWAMRECWRDFSISHPGGESSAAAQRRAVTLHRDLVHRHPGETIVIATHGNLLALLVNHYFPHQGYQFWKALTNPDVYCLAVQPDGDSELLRLWR
jgi:2,3-bisphosphoglycerate-dependent phosphoglycerate mutase